MLKDKTKFLKKLSFPAIIVLLLCLGFLVRTYFAGNFIRESGDIRLFADWGEKFWEYGPKDFYTYKEWYYAPPNYPPFLSLTYAASFWLYDHKYYLAQLHNLIRIPPAVFIIYFYKFGYYLLLKIPGILADLGLSLLIYKIVYEISKNKLKSLVGMILYLFNPVPIFLSGIWGQTDSLVAFFGLFSFYALVKKNLLAAIPLLFVSLYLKPNWAIFVPFFVFLAFLIRPKLRGIFLGALISLVIFYLVTKVFADGNLISFSRWLYTTRILPTANAAHKVSVSAFNFYTIFFKIDAVSDSTKILGTVPAFFFGILAFLLVNLLAFSEVVRKKATLLSVTSGLFIIGLGGYLFLTNMLERYFFPAFSSLIILSIVKPKVLLSGLIINLIVLANIYYSFFRRSLGVVADFFTANSELAIKTLSLLNVTFFLVVLKNLECRLNLSFLLQFMRGRNRGTFSSHRRNRLGDC